MLETFYRDNTKNERVLTEPERRELYAIREKYFNYLKIHTQNNENPTLEHLDQLYPLTDDLEKLLKQIDDLKKCLDSFRPFDTFQLENLEEYYETLYTYESNRIEGNSLTLNETHLVINEGLTIGGKPLKDHLEAVNHKKAYQYIRELVKTKSDLNERAIFEIHNLILRTINDTYAGRYRNVRVRVLGSQYVFPNPYKISGLMKDFLKWYEENKTRLHPVLLAAEIHEKLVTIHPFVDGNGRTSRLVMNLILLQNGFPIVNISGDKNEKQKYYKALEQAQMKSNKIPFLKLILNEEKKSLFHYVSMFADNMEKTDKGYYFFKKIGNLLEKNEQNSSSRT